MSPEHAVAHEADRGRMAEKPEQITAKGWWDIAVRVKDQIDADNVSIVAAGLALFGMLAIFPSLAAAVAIYGLFSSPTQIAEQVEAFRGVLPDAGLQILNTQLHELISHQDTALSAGAVVGILLALWSARRGMVALMTATNVAYNERERRGFFHRLFLSLVLTLGAVLALIAVVMLGIAVPLVLHFLPLGDIANWVLLSVRWILLWSIVVVGLSAVYHFAPNRTEAKWRWVSWGAAIAATLWLLSSIGFALYVRQATSFGETYGALGGVVIMLMWFYISGFVIILGAEINSEMERQTVKDTTDGAPKPIGKRGAFSADTVGPPAGSSSQENPA